MRVLLLALLSLAASVYTKPVLYITAAQFGLKPQLENPKITGYMEDEGVKSKFELTFELKSDYYPYFDGQYEGEENLVNDQGQSSGIIQYTLLDPAPAVNEMVKPPVIRKRSPLRVMMEYVRDVGDVWSAEVAVPAVDLVGRRTDDLDGYFFSTRDGFLPLEFPMVRT